jgi:tetratricopeptide (TPR) repeat protein
MLEQALHARNELSGDEQTSLAISLSSLAEVYSNQGRFEEAEPLYKRALDIHEKLLDPDDLRLAKTRNNLAKLYTDMHRFNEAEHEFRSP